MAARGSALGSTPTGSGFWIVSPSGSLSSHGDAQDYGSPAASGVHLNRPTIGIDSTPDGDEYWLVASDGGVFAFGDAPFDGSAATSSSAPIAGLIPASSGGGYSLITVDGDETTYPER